MRGAATEEPATVLVVEDDVDIRESLEELLTLEGLRVVTAEDGLAALALLEQLDPALVLVDLMMPRLSGPDLIARVRSGKHRAIPIAVLSASPGPMPGGADAFLRKPFDAEALLGLVRRYCKQAKVG